MKEKYQLRTYALWPKSQRKRASLQVRSPMPAEPLPGSGGSAQKPVKLQHAPRPHVRHGVQEPASAIRPLPLCRAARWVPPRGPHRRAAWSRTDHIHRPANSSAAVPAAQLRPRSRYQERPERRHGPRKRKYTHAGTALASGVEHRFDVPLCCSIALSHEGYDQ